MFKKIEFLISLLHYANEKGISYKNEYLSLLVRLNVIFVKQNQKLSVIHNSNKNTLTQNLFQKTLISGDLIKKNA